jgi:hypothetical protein
MIPLVARTAKEPHYVTLDAALATGRFRVTEVSDAGHVPELFVSNDLDTAVLLLDGEELVGAKQNRVVNLTILVPAKTSLSIPVSCVEAGRWHHVTAEFRGSSRAQFLEGRAQKLAQVTRSLAATARAASDQGDVWDRINRRSAQLGVHSPTAAMHDVYEQHKHSVDEFVRALSPVDGQVGAALAIGGRLAGVEFFDSARTLRALLPKIVSSYALDAVAALATSTPSPVDGAQITAWVRAIAEREPRVHKAVGVGEALRWESPGVTAAALAVDDEFVHFVAFPLDVDAEAGPSGPRMRSASSRRRQ